MFFLYLLGVVVMAGVIYLAVSRKSTFKIRIAALGALALMIVSVVICMVVYFKGAGAPQQFILPDMMPSDMPPPQSKQSPVTMIMLVVFMIVVFVVVVFLALKEQRRAEGKEPPPSNEW